MKEIKFHNKPMKLIRYKSLRKCLSEGFGCPVNKLKTYRQAWRWKDEDGKKCYMPFQKAVDTIKKNRSIWGFIRNKKEIHYFVRKDAKMNDIVEFFAHELGHAERPYYRDRLDDEQKSCKYGNIAKIAYEAAVKCKKI